MAHHMEKVTVLIPTYNHGSVVAYQIDSLLKQSSLPRRIVILDDGSTDNTSEILAKYRDFPAITVLRHEKNLGIHAAIGTLLNHVDTEFFAFAAADDMLAAGWCQTTAALLEKYQDARMVVSNSFILEGQRAFVTDAVAALKGKPEGIYEPSQFADLIKRRGTLPPTNTILYRSNIIEELIRPILSRKDLGSLIDVILILAIATKYPVAYSIHPAGLFIRDNESYGNVFYSKDHLSQLLERIETFSNEQGQRIDKRLVEFLSDFIAYSWGKKMILAELHERSKGLGGLGFGSVCLIRLIGAFIRHKRYKFLKLNSSSRKIQFRELSKLIHGGLLERVAASVVR